MRSPGHSPSQRGYRPLGGACADLPQSSPSLSRDPGSLETRRRVPDGGALDSEARASLPASFMVDGWPTRPVRFHGLPCGAGRAMPACQPGARGRRRECAEYGLEGSVPTASSGA
ncbi:Single Ig Il-1-Related Receptor [Manis pentadactyla]|nr:Single Ig Il-1-Related Receptor [Manis pentadactyla]